VTVEAATFGGLWLFYTLTYGDDRLLAEASATSLSYLVLAAGVVVGGGLAMVGTYLLILRSRLWGILLILSTCCVPAIFCACVFLYSLLIFLCLL